MSLQTDVPLAPLTTWRVGGAARYFAEPRSHAEIRTHVEWACAEGQPVYVIGRGSNILVDDAGVPGLVLCLRRTLGEVRYDAAQQAFIADAGCPLPRIATFARRHAVPGFEFMLAIPGSVGGAVVINAGVGGRNGESVSARLRACTLLDTRSGDVCVRTADSLELGYRSSALLDGPFIVLDATFDAAAHDEPDAIRGRESALLGRRSDKQPLSKRTAGSVFKQPPGGEPAGWYLERAGMRGRRVGGAEVSQRHANWIEAGQDATAADIRTLMDIMTAAVQAEFGITLEREVRFLPDPHAS